MCLIQNHQKQLGIGNLPQAVGNKWQAVGNKIKFSIMKHDHFISLPLLLYGGTYEPIESILHEVEHRKQNKTTCHLLVHKEMKVLFFLKFIQGQ